MAMGGHWRMVRMNMDPDQKQQLSHGLWRRVFRFARPHWTAIGVYMVTVVVSAVLVVIPPLTVGRLVDHLTNISIQSRSGRVPPNALKIINLLGAVVVGVALVNTAFSILSRYLSSKVGESVIFDLRTALFARVQRMPIAFFTRTQTGALISRLNNDVVGAQRALTQTVGGILSDIIRVGVTVLVMTALSRQLTLLALIILPVFIFPAKRFGKKMQKIVRDQMNLNASMNSTMTERFNVSGALLVKLFGNRSAEVSDFSDRAGQVRDTGIKLSLYMGSFFVALGLVGAVGTGIVYWMGGRLVVLGGLKIGSIVAFAALTNQLYGPLAGLTNARVDLMTAFVSFDRVFEILDLPQIVDESPDAIALPPGQGHVTFKDVWFRYPSSEEVPIGSLDAKLDSPVATDWVLRDLSFEIAPGEMVALVGPSGAGKTTISSLVPRLYDATEGSVSFDGHDVRDVTLESLSQTIGVVTQDAHLFHESLKDNLLYAKPDASETELIAACTAARIHDLIASLPDGYDTVVGERGYRLSGGEKQRVAIARVLLKNPKLLILDEATAHLDSESEVLIQRALATAMEGRSSLVIAHRLSTIVAADKILVVDKGRIVEQGPHAELIRNGGLYSDLYRTQFASSVAM